MIEISSRFWAAIDDEVIDLLGLRALEEHGVGLVWILIGVVRILWVVVLLIVGVELLIALRVEVVDLAGRVSSLIEVGVVVGVVVGVELHEIIGGILLLILGVLCPCLLGPDKIIVLLYAAGLELLHDLFGCLNLLLPLQRTILRRTHKLPLHLLLSRKGNDQLFLFIGHGLDLRDQVRGLCLWDL